ncbi:MAG: FAD binding domain-containing protein, partial [Lachnospiraceae bacterium]|nr:FAD binding domain-containing protein [Lachnospiraceae bacterium]
MVLPQFTYMTASTVEEACNLLLEHDGKAKVMAGATDLIPPMRDKVFTPEYIIDLKKIPGLDTLSYDEE